MLFLLLISSYSLSVLSGIGHGNVISDYTVVKTHFKLTTGHQKQWTLHRGKEGGVDGVSGQVRNGEGLWRKDLVRWKGEIREGIINGARTLWSRRFVWRRMQSCMQDNRERWKKLISSPLAQCEIGRYEDLDRMYHFNQRLHFEDQWD